MGPPERFLLTCGLPEPGYEVEEGAEEHDGRNGQGDPSEEETQAFELERRVVDRQRDRQRQQNKENLEHPLEEDIHGTLLLEVFVWSFRALKYPR
jgi:hypothetical protein